MICACAFILPASAAPDPCKEFSGGAGKGGELVKRLKQGHVTFASDLFSFYAEQQETFVISPFLISKATALVSVKIGKSAWTELSKISKCFEKPTFMRSIYTRWSCSADNDLIASKGKYRFPVSIWVNNSPENSPPGKTNSPESAFFTSHYHKTNLEKEPAAAVKEMNSWLYRSSGKKLAEAVTEKAVKSWMNMVIVSGAYAEPAWEVPFISTIELVEFKRADGEVSLVPGMISGGLFRYLKTKEHQLLAFDLEGGALELIIITPQNDTAQEALWKAPHPILSGTLLDKVKPKEHVVSLPQISLTSTLELADFFRSKGAHGVFGTKTAPKQAVVGLALHHVSVLMNPTPKPPALYQSVNPDIVINRPFMFILRSTASDAIMLMGRVTIL